MPGTNLSIGLIPFRNRELVADKIVIKAVFSVIFALLMWVSANSFIYLPFSPVPVTMQVFTVLLSAIMLGRYWAAAAQMQYIIMGIAGLPVFAGFKNAAAVVYGPTAGYIAGFVAGAFITGFIFDKYKEKISAPSMALFFACLSGLAAIYSSGFIHLTGFLYISGAAGNTAEAPVIKAFKLGIAPFIITDMVKIAIILNIFQLKGDYEKNQN